MTDARAQPGRDCDLCPRLAAFRAEQRAQHPDWFNAPVPGFGDPQAWLAVVGLAPGLTGANRTGRPFTGDQAGGMLYKTMAGVGLVRGAYDGHADDGMALDGVMVLNAVQCVPPENRPVAAEINSCRAFMTADLDRLPNLSTIIALGTIAHASIVRAHGETAGRYRFGHGAEHRLPGGRLLIDSYHCSRYNQNTGRLTDAMFSAVFARAVEMQP